MTQEIINKYFQSDLGKQCNSLFTTADDKVFISYKHAKDHAEKLFNEEVIEWFEEYSGKDLEPQIRQQNINS